MESIDALARAIKAFEGGVVIVSHDFREPLVSCAYRSSLPNGHYLHYRPDFTSRRRALGSQRQNHKEFDQGRHHHRRL